MINHNGNKEKIQHYPKMPSTYSLGHKHVLSAPAYPLMECFSLGPFDGRTRMTMNIYGRLSGKRGIMNICASLLQANCPW